ncbi:hypothetical protein Tco_1151309 [Tanacetum coccineum]
MNQEEIRQVTTRDEKWVPTKERVKISTTNVRLETTVPQKEQTFQVIIDVIKISTCYKAFTISVELPKIFMQQFWYIVKKVKGTNSYEFHLANKKCLVDAEVSNIQVSQHVCGPHALTMGNSGCYYQQLSFCKRVIKKKVLISADDNIIPELDVALELATSRVSKKMSPDSS